MKKVNLLLIICSVLAAFHVFAQVPNYVPQNNLIGWWPFDGNANDIVGNNDGLVDGAILTLDRNGNQNSAYFFNGSSKISCSLPSIPATGSFTISFWVNPANISGVQEFFHQNTWPSAFYVGMNGGNLRCGDLWQSTGVMVNSSTWQHFVIRRNYLTNVEIFVDGYLQGSLGSDIIIGGNVNDSLVFGKQYGANLEYYFGAMDEFGIWDRALTYCEIIDLNTSQLNTINWGISAGPDQTICFGDSVVLNASGGMNYQWNNNVVDGQSFIPTESSDYVVIGDSIGCIDIDTVVVTVLENASSTLTETALDTYTLNGQTYTESGTYTQTLTAANGCDSTITLNLTLNFTGMDELSTSAKKLVKITDLNGKIIPRRKNTLMLFIYEEGTVERVVEMEE